MSISDFYKDRFFQQQQKQEEIYAQYIPPDDQQQWHELDDIKERIDDYEVVADYIPTDSACTMREMIAGVIVLGIALEIVGVFIASSTLYYTISLWLGIAMAAASAYHMWRVLDKALDFEQENARAIVQKQSMLRYGIIIIIFGVLMITEWADPLIVFLGLMMLKVTAYLQPLTHKIYIKWNTKNKKQGGEE